MDELDELVAVVPPLLSALEALDFIARYLHPPDLKACVDHFAEHDAPLRAARPRLETWTSGTLADVRANLTASVDGVLAAFDSLRAATTDPSATMREAYRAMRRLPQAQETLYPLAAMLPPVSRYFLDPDQRADEALLERIHAAGARENTGVMHAGAEPGARGGFSLYVPEYYDPSRKWPLVMALHGGGGNGRAFLWSWLRDARGLGAIVCAPTAIGNTWALSDPDDDTPNLTRILDLIRSRWNIDDSRILFTGMSDGGTFTYASGLEGGSPFTHLAPIAASFHPVLAQMADPDRLRGLPIYVIHGALDWMFAIDIAREAQASLAGAGADVMYWELDDLSHTYPREVNSVLLEWLNLSR